MEAKKTIKVTTASGSLVYTGDCIVAALRWVGADAAGDTVVVQDNAGNERWAAEANGANYTEESGVIREFLGGIKVTTLASGTFYIDLARND